MREVICSNCSVPIGKSPHNFNTKVIFCWNCSGLKENGYEYDLVLNWLENEHPEVLAQLAQYLEEEE